MSTGQPQKTHVVTGASSGIGACTAALLKRGGARIIGVDIRPSGDCDEFLLADLGDADAIDALLTRLPDGLAGLVNVAGVPPTLSPEVVLRVNFFGLRRLTMGLVGRLAERASIVNVASLAGFSWRQNIADVRRLCAADFGDDLAMLSRDLGLNRVGRSYFLTKEALIFWTMQNRWSWRERGIRMNCVSPGPVLTPIHADFQATLGARAAEDARLMDRPATPDDIAPIIAFMLGEDSRWIRGANIPADGGMSAKLTLDQV